MKLKTALKTVLIILGVILAVELTLLPGQRSHDLTHPDVQVNPPQKVIDQSDIVKQIDHILVIPKEVIDNKKPVILPVDVTVKDPKTGTETKTDTTATVTPTEDGGVNVTIPDTITVTLPEPIEEKWSVCYAGGFGVSYQVLSFKQIDADLILTVNGVGAGITYPVYRNIHLGISENVGWDGKLSTNLMVKIPLDLSN